MSLVSQSIKLYAWKSNNVRFLAVEGEADSRMFYIQLYNTSAPIDLTNSNVKFFASKPDSTSVYCDCTIVDDIQGIVQLVLPEQMTTVSGDVDCWIQVTSADGSDLRFEGMVLEVASCGLNASAESSDDMETLREASQKVDAFTTELRNARFGEDSLGKKIEKMDRKSASNSSRIDSLVAGATEQDQNFANEVIDARTDSTGTTHSSLGEALRTIDALTRECESDLVDQGLLLQTQSQKIATLEEDSTSLKSDLSLLANESIGDKVVVNIEIVDKKYISTRGEEKAQTGWFYTEPILLKKGETIAYKGISYSVATFSKVSNPITFPTQVLLAPSSSDTSNKEHTYTATEDCYVSISGSTIEYVKIKNPNSKLNQIETNISNLSTISYVENKCTDAMFDGNRWYSSHYNLSVSDGILTATLKESGYHSRIEYSYNFVPNHTYFIYSEIRSNKYIHANHYIEDYSEEFEVYKGNEFAPVFSLHTPTVSCNKVGFYINNNFPSIAGDKIEMKKPIIIDVTEEFEETYTTKSLSSYEVGTNNSYITTQGEVTPASGYFISSAIFMRSGDKITVKATDGTGTFSLLAKCDSSGIPTESLIMFNASYSKNVTYSYTATEDCYVVVSGTNDSVTMKTYPHFDATKYVKIAYNWTNPSEKYRFAFSKDNVNAYKYVIASKDSSQSKYADIVCTGENDQVLINYVIKHLNGNSVYFADDSVFNITAPVITESNVSLVSNGATFVMCDVVTDTVTAVENNKYITVSDTTKFVKGAYLYCNDNNQYNYIKEVYPSTNQIELGIAFDYGNTPYAIRTASPAILISEQSDVVIDGLHIDLNVENNPIQSANPWYLQEGVTIDYSKNVTVKNCKICNGGRRGITTYDATHFNLINNYFDNWHEHSIDIFCDYSAHGNTTSKPIMCYGVITGNICENNQMSGIQCHRGSGCTIANNVIRNVQHAGLRVQEYAHDNTLTGNVIENAREGILLDAYNIVCTGNLIKDCRHTGVSLTYHTSKVNFVGNTILNTAKNAVRIAGAVGCNVSNNILNNSCCADGLTSNEDKAIVSFGNAGVGKNNVITNNTISEDERTNKPTYVYYNDYDTNVNNYFVRNVLTGTSDMTTVKNDSDVVKDNDTI